MYQKSALEGSKLILPSKKAAGEKEHDFLQN